MACGEPEGRAGIVTRISDLAIEGPHGTIPIRHYQPDYAGAPAPGLVWLHGGSWIGGDLDMPEADWVSRELASRGIAVVSVSYRLAPWFDLDTRPFALALEGNHFPIPHDETVFAFEWVSSHAADVGMDPARISLGGASAGGNLAAGGALALRDRAGAQPRSILLAYPVVHSSMPTPRRELAEKVAALPVEATFPDDVVEAMGRNFLGPRGDPRSAYAFPGGHDLHGLPPTFVLLSDHDTLRSSGEAFASELVMAGVDVLAIREEGTRHGHLNTPEELSATASVERMSEWLHATPLVGLAHADRTLLAGGGPRHAG